MVVSFCVCVWLYAVWLDCFISCVRLSYILQFTLSLTKKGGPQMKQFSLKRLILGWENALFSFSFPLGLLDIWSTIWFSFFNQWWHIPIKLIILLFKMFFWWSVCKPKLGHTCQDKRRWLGDIRLDPNWHYQWFFKGSLTTIWLGVWYLIQRIL